MPSRFRLPSLFTVSAAALLATACASSPDAPDAVAADEVILCDATNAPRWYVSLRDRSCEILPGNGGWWIPSALFPGAPPRVLASTCAYDWRVPVGSEKVTPDVAVLKAFVDPDHEVLTPVCTGPVGVAPSASMADVYEVYEIPPNGGGSQGCDVCGIVDEDQLYVVLPPDEIVLYEFAVPLSNGETRWLKLDAGAAYGGTFSVPLPALPDGLDYVDGYVTVY